MSVEVRDWPDMKEDRGFPKLAHRAANAAARYVMQVDGPHLLVRHANAAATEFLGCDEVDLIGMPIADLIEQPEMLPANDKGPFQALIRASGGWSYPVQMWLEQPKDSMITTVRWTVVHPLFAPDQVDVFAQLRAAIEVLPDAFVVYDPDDRLVLCNQRYRDIYTKSAPAMVPGETFENILRYGLRNGEYADGIGREEDWLAERLDAHRRADTTVEQMLSDGRCLRILERKTPDGGRVGLRIDITAQVESRNRARQAEQRLRDAIEALPAGFSLHDKDDNFLMFNEKYKSLYSASADGLREGISYKDFIQHGLENGQYPEAEGQETNWLKNQIENRARDQHEQEYQLDDGRWIRSLNQRTSEGGLVGFRLDITEQKRRQLALERTSTTDALTGIANRRGVTTYLERASSELGSAERLIFLHVDLDKFKAINDVIGHDAGDFVLQTVSQILETNVRAQDLVARIGGDEFLVTLKTTISPDAALKFAERIRLQVSEPIKFKNRLCHVGASIGISIWSKEIDTTIQQALLDADIALNDCKSRGRHRCTLFHKKMRQSTVQSAQLAQEIIDGLKAKEFVPWFQPQTDITGRHLDGFEVLARWNHPKHGPMSAGSFLFAAEDAGLVASIDRDIFAKTLEFANRLSKTRWRHLKFSVNLSNAQLSDPEIVDEYLAQLAAYGLPPQLIRIEILESILLDERSSNVVENIRMFADEGFAIELDDFGTGHTAIASLRQFPVERIKIDRSLIHNIHKEPELRVITDAVTGLGRKLGLKVLAEGVETEEERKVVEAIGCTCLQGYLLAAPMPEEDILCWLDEYVAASGPFD